MEKITCDIIEDLLPSYVDGICSEATRQCVEEHMETCEKCRKKVKLLKEMDFSVKKLEQKQLDSVKKVKRYIQTIGFISYISLAIVILLGFFVMECKHGELPASLYLVAMSALMLGAYLLTLHQTEKAKIGKSDSLLGILSVLAGAYSVFLVYYSFENRSDKGLFGIERSELGPFIYWQLIGMVILQFLILAWTLLKTMKKGFVSSIVPNLNITGIFLSWSLCSWLKRMDSYYIEISIIKTTKLVFVIGIAGTVVIYLIDKYRWFIDSHPWKKEKSEK